MIEETVAVAVCLPGPGPDDVMARVAGRGAATGIHDGLGAPLGGPETDTDVALCEPPTCRTTRFALLDADGDVWRLELQAQIDASRAIVRLALPYGYPVWSVDGAVVDLLAGVEQDGATYVWRAGTTPREQL